MNNHIDSNSTVKFQSQQYKIRKRGSSDIEVYVRSAGSKKRIKPVNRGK